MLIRRLAAGVIVDAPAKLNLFFEVLGRRDDGYHEIETLMVPIDLFDSLRFEENSSGQITFECWDRRATVGPNASGTGVESLPVDDRNLAVRAVDLIRRREGVRHGATLRLVKRIPIAAGLGGGSSDAAAALVAANKVWRLGLRRQELEELAAELGSDVPFFLHGGPAVCRGRGERIEPVTAAAGAMAFVVVCPPDGLSTAAVYRDCCIAESPRRIDPVLRIVEEGDWTNLGRLLFNRLQPTARVLNTWISKLEDALGQEDCLGHLMSGSGTCYFGLCRHMRHARRMA
ncbi:MAG: 4-(cytidine 5'-diphospho)-2-C-methyl-D-erythritol kinase, partial [Pirellulaceae bacterium]|nr:4-(cytidine 5'-diphospho)-2-C-methyl-D-erythritol kinase [Pirellulaceae bacterium]